MSPYDRPADLIEGVLAGRMSAAEAIVETKGFPDAAWNDCLLAEACHMLIHFCDDEDIRERDPGYASWQREGLAGLASRLRSVG
jgi:hypothetical protein